MKRIQIVIVALLVTCSLIASFIFANKSSHKPFGVIVTIYYLSTKNEICGSCPNKLVHSELCNAANWSFLSLGTPPSHGSSNYLLAASYDSTKATKQQAVTAICNQWNNGSGSLPADGSAFNASINGQTVAITIFRQEPL